MNHTRIAAVGVAILLVTIASAQQRAVKIVTIAGGLVYHREDCASIGGHQIEVIERAALTDRHRPCAMCRPDFDAPPLTDTPTDISFLVTEPLDIREKPEADAAIIGKLALLDIVMVYRGEGGWLRINAADGGRTGTPEPTKGWIRPGPGGSANLIDRDLLSTLRLKRELDERTAWTRATKMDILLKRVRIGFTKEQVTMALDEPTVRTSDETAKGVTDVWAYPRQAITFSDGKVSAIKRVEVK